jgi:hypothetical protein
MSLGSTATNTRVYGSVLIWILAGITAIGKRAVNRASVLFFVVVVITLISGLIGLLASNRPGLIEGIDGFPGAFSENWGGGYGEVDENDVRVTANFYELFGIFFPAFTGFKQIFYLYFIFIFYINILGVLSGASRSTELKDPQVYIPKGLVLSHATSSFMCMIILILLEI